MNNKYNLEFSNDVIKASVKYLINQVWKLIPMKEKSEDWKSQLSKVIIEIIGLSVIFMQEPKFLILLTKLEGLLNSDSSLDFDIYRKEIFESINLIHELGEELYDE